TYTFTVTNAGNVTMTDVSVNDLSDFTGENPFPALVFGGNSGTSAEGTLEPGESATYTATYTLTQNDVNQGGVDNVATAVGTPPTTDPDDPAEPITPVESVPGDPEDPATPLDPTDEPGEPTVVDIPAEPSLSLVKAASVDAGTDEVVNAGDVVTYTFTVTNTGNVTMTNVSVNDSPEDFTGEGAINTPAFVESTGSS